MLGFAAGVMMSACYLSLIVPAAAFSRNAGHSSFAAAGIVALAVLIGAGSLHAVRRWEPFQHAFTTDAHTPPEVRRRALAADAGDDEPQPSGRCRSRSGVRRGDARIALSTAIGIGIQNLPEGLAVAAAMLSIGRKPWTAVLIGGLTGIVEPVGAFLGVSLVSLVQGLLPWGMGWAAGAMLYICAAELIPAVHEEDGHINKALAAVLVGIAGMLFLDIALS